MAARRRLRLLASLTTSTALLYLASFSPTSALDTDPGTAPEALLDHLIIDRRDDAQAGGLGISYESEFTVFGGGSLKERASDGINVLGNNEPKKFTLKRGATAYFAFSLDGLTARDEPAPPDGPPRRDAVQEKDGSLGAEGNASRDRLPRRQEASRTVFLSANICRYPERVDDVSEGAAAPSLRLLVSPDASDEHPDISKPTTETNFFYEGATTKLITASTSAVYFAIESPDLPNVDLEGDWNLEVAVSTDDWYHSFEEDESSDILRTVGVDNGVALLTTRDLVEDSEEAEAIMDSGLPYTLFVYNANSPQLRRVRRSQCGLENYAEVASGRDGEPSRRVITSITTRGPSKLPKQQFRIEGLDATTAYTAMLVRTSHRSLVKRQDESSGSGGVRTFPEMQFETATGKASNERWHDVLQLTLYQEIIARSSPTLTSVAMSSTLSPPTRIDLTPQPSGGSTMTTRERCTATSRRPSNRFPARLL